MSLYSTKHKEPHPKEMLEWIRETFSLSQNQLGWMFQVSPKTIKTWLNGERIKRAYRMKIRKSYYYLTGKQDPYAGLVFCEKCQAWKESAEFAGGSVVCKQCKKEGKP